MPNPGTGKEVKGAALKHAVRAWLSGWHGGRAGLGEDRNSLAAFLFTWPGGTHDPAAQPIKLPKARFCQPRIPSQNLGAWFACDKCVILCAFCKQQMVVTQHFPCCSDGVSDRPPCMTLDLHPASQLSVCHSLISGGSCASHRDHACECSRRACAR